MGKEGVEDFFVVRGVLDAAAVVRIGGKYLEGIGQGEGVAHKEGVAFDVFGELHVLVLHAFAKQFLEGGEAEGEGAVAGMGVAGGEGVAEGNTVRRKHEHDPGQQGKHHEDEQEYFVRFHETV